MKYVWALFAFIAVTGGAYRIHPLLGTYLVMILLALWLIGRVARWNRMEVRRARW